VNQVSRKAARKLRSRQDPKNVWYGFGLFGLVGWSVMVPALLGIALGIWIDRTFPSRYSWTLMLMILGVGLGCLNAWYWIQKESNRE
jgi:ATP synthase protein I